MNDDLKILKDIGAQRIHNETHISREYVQAIIHETFDGLQSVQFVGFVSILEREYHVDLSDLKAKGLEYFRDEDEKSDKVKKVFITPKKKKSNSTMYVVLGIILFSSLIYYTFNYINSATPTIEVVDNTKIDNVTNNIIAEPELIVVADTNLTLSTVEETTDVNATIEEVEVVEEAEVEEVIKTLKIQPKNKIWAGYINIETNQKYQKIFRKEFALDVSKNWLLLFGSGTVYLEVNGEQQKFSSKQNMRFKYKDGEFTKITVTEFKSLNKGRKW